MVKLLLEYGADVTRKDYQGRTPLDMLNERYESVKNMISAITGGHSFCKEYDPLQSDPLQNGVATLLNEKCATSFGSKNIFLKVA